MPQVGFGGVHGLPRPKLSGTLATRPAVISSRSAGGSRVIGEVPGRGAAGVLAVSLSGFMTVAGLQQSCRYPSWYQPCSHPCCCDCRMVAQFQTPPVHYDITPQRNSCAVLCVAKVEVANACSTATCITLPVCELADEMSNSISKMGWSAIATVVATAAGAGTARSIERHLAAGPGAIGVEQYTRACIAPIHNLK